MLHAGQSGQYVAAVFFRRLDEDVYILSRADHAVEDAGMAACDEVMGPFVIQKGTDAQQRVQGAGGCLPKAGVFLTFSPAFIFLVSPCLKVKAKGLGKSGESFSKCLSFASPLNASFC